jgi:hypothetical protein
VAREQHRADPIVRARASRLRFRGVARERDATKPTQSRAWHIDCNSTRERRAAASLGETSLPSLSLQRFTMRLFFGPIALLALTSGCIIDHTDGTAGYSGETYYSSNNCATGGTTSTGGTSTGGNDDAGGGTGDAGDAGVVTPPPPPPTCAELQAEAACKLRSDCQPIYAGTDCSCGPNCTCFDGVEGCTCEHFAYFTCVASDAALPPTTR